jgi:hypothetical protein
MVPLTRCLTAPADRLREDAAVLNSRDVEPSPAAHMMVFSTSLLVLKRQQPWCAVAHAVIVRLSDSHGGLVRESNQAVVRNRESELAIKGVLV